MNNDHYIILNKYDNVEIRKYNEMILASYTSKINNERNNSFRTIADFIFGGNDKNENISMTSPVIMKLETNEMAFIMPNGYSLLNIPKPNNNKINIYKEESKLKACIRYSGYTNKRKEIIKINELKEILKKNNIEHNGDFSVLVYNSPYKFFNRRNEISVTLKKKNNSMNIKKIYLGGGCFWCTEAIFEDVIGVNNVLSGFSGGLVKNPSYREVINGKTNHAEVCEITYDENIINLENILEIFFLSHDPTTINRQGNDIGSHYRSIILYNNENERNIIINYINKLNTKIFDNKIVTEIIKFNAFYKAEDYHQNYYKLNKNLPYCKTIISKKIIESRKKINKYFK